ncbi:hypothetical protein ES708_19887 [subsurface metagenome]
MINIPQSDLEISNKKEFEGIDFSKVAMFFWLYRMFIIKVEVVFLIIGIIIALILPKTFTSVATILPAQSTSSSSRILSRLSNYAGNIPSRSGEYYVELYPDIVKSRAILTEVLNAPYQSETFIKTLKKEYDINTDNIESVITLLKNKFVKCTLNNRTHIITIAAITHNPEFSASLVNEILIQLEKYFNNRMKFVAKNQRIMIEERLIDIADSLLISENKLLRFNEGNRQPDNSPTLKINEIRLLREVEINSKLYIELSQQLEIAKINEFHDKPFLNILDNAVPPLKRTSPQRKSVVLKFLLVGFIFSISYIKIKKIIYYFTHLIKR